MEGWQLPRDVLSAPVSEWKTGRGQSCKMLNGGHQFPSGMTPTTESRVETNGKTTAIIIKRDGKDNRRVGRLNRGASIHLGSWSRAGSLDGDVEVDGK